MKKEKKAETYKITPQDLIRNNGEAFLIPCFLQKISQECKTEKKHKEKQYK